MTRTKIGNMKDTLRMQCVLLLFITTLMAFTAYGGAAGSMVDVDYTKNLVGQAELSYGYMMPIKALKGAQEISAKYSGNGAVGVNMWPASKETGMKYPTLQIRCNSLPKKKSSGTITVSGKLDGKKKGLKIKLTLLNKKYVCPAKAFKIGTTAFQKQFKKTDVVQLSSKKWKALAGKKIKVAPVKGWKLQRIRQYIWNNNGGQTAKTYTIRNNGKLKTVGKNQSTQIELLFQNTKTGMLDDIALMPQGIPE